MSGATEPRPDINDAEAAEFELRQAGVIDMDAPSPFAHQRRVRALGAEFTAAERRHIRVSLGLYDEVTG